MSNQSSDDGSVLLVRRTNPLCVDLEAEVTRLREDVARLRIGTVYRMVELKEGAEVQYVAVHAMKWRPEWGRPDVGFLEVDTDE